MEDQVNFCIDLITEKMSEAIAHLQLELSKIRAGRASTSVLDGVVVDYLSLIHISEPTRPY